MDLIDLTELLDRSRATDEFKADVIALAEHRPAPRVELARHAPRVKVLRVLAQLASAEPEFAIDFVRVDGLSGCSDFRGVLVARSADGVERTFEFLWDCQWRALQEGWTDYFGLPDQIRAARAFGWQCFATWAERAAPVEAMSRG